MFYSCLHPTGSYEVGPWGHTFSFQWNYPPHVNHGRPTEINSHLYNYEYIYIRSVRYYYNLIGVITFVWNTVFSYIIWAVLVNVIMFCYSLVWWIHVLWYSFEYINSSTLLIVVPLLNFLILHLRWSKMLASKSPQINPEFMFRHLLMATDA